MMTTKDRRNSGRKVTKIYNPVNEPYEEVKYDEWDDYRDGFRQLGRDKTKITSISTVQRSYKYRVYKGTNVEETNQKNKKMLKIRKTRRIKNER